jgi:hypothetical protein
MGHPSLPTRLPVSRSSICNVAPTHQPGRTRHPQTEPFELEGTPGEASDPQDVIAGMGSDSGAGNPSMGLTIRGLPHEVFVLVH